MPLRILTVDDSKTVRIIIRNAFKRFDCEIIEAAHGMEGLDKAKCKPDLVLLDITMPIMDGIEMLAKLRAMPDSQNLPVVMLTAEGQKATAEQAMALGARSYITKPFSNEALIEQISKIVQLQERSSAAA